MEFGVQAIHKNFVDVNKYIQEPIHAKKPLVPLYQVPKGAYIG